MKNLTSLLVVLCINFVTMAGDWPYKRLDRLYNTDPTKCLAVSKRYIKYLPDNPVAYYFASIVYRDKSKTHLETKTRYMMMSKSIGYAMKFENFEDVDLEIKVRWESYIDELRTDTYDLASELWDTEISNLGDRLAIKHQKMVDNREEILLVSNGTDPTQLAVPATNSSEEGSSEPEVSEPESESPIKAGYYGLATGKEVTQSYNKIQEGELLKLINEERAALFMTPLKWEEDLARAARYHAYDMATQDYFYADSYDRLDGELVLVADEKSRNSQFHPRKHLNAQNIAGGSINAIETYDQWLKYDKEYDVLFDEESKKVGIGVFYDPSSALGYYWVLVTSKK